MLGCSGGGHSSHRGRGPLAPLRTATEDSNKQIRCFNETDWNQLRLQCISSSVYIFAKIILADFHKFSLAYSVKILSYRMDQKLSTKFFFIYSPNTDGFYSFYISEGSAATQFRCDGMYGKHFITNFPQDAPVKNFENRSIFGKDMDRVCGLLFGPQCTCR